MTVGETAMAIALADSLFLSVSPDAARGKIILFLAVSMAPFAVVSPLIGPRIDRMKGGHRMVVILVGIMRALVLLGISQVLSSKEIVPSIGLYLLVFSSMILGKTYAIAKSAIVPTVEEDEEDLVKANSKLGQIAGITGFVVAAPIAVLQLMSSTLALGFGMLAFLFAALNAYRLPKSAIAPRPAEQIEIEELHSTSIVSTGNAMRILRGCVGFMFFHLAFWLRGEVAGTAWFGFALGMIGIAVLGANTFGPFMKKHMRESMMMLSALLAVGVCGIIAAWYDRVVGGILLAAIVNAAGTIGKLSFDSTVQSDAPDANRGRAFAQFETKNQLAWVVGGIIPVIFSPSGQIGFIIVAVVGLAGAAMYYRAGGLSTKSRVSPTRDPELPLRSE
jgi:MFS family permease